MRKVINKMVTEEDLIRTVTAAYGAGWRQVKLYFMCGLPTETDEDVLQIADLAKKVIAAGREISGTRDIRCTVSIGGFVPKPHTPFQWAAQLGAEATDARLAKLRDAIRSDRQYARAIGFRYHDGQPGIVEGLLSRGDRRVGAVIRKVWEDGGRFDGWSEHFSYDRWMRAAADGFRRYAGRRRLVHHARARADRGAALGPPGLRPGQGLALGGLAGLGQRGRGRGLPLDALLRLRRLPADGHRHRDRPDRQDPAAADRPGRDPRPGPRGAGRVSQPDPPAATPDDDGADATYWGRYKGRWRQCFVLLFVIGFVVITIERVGEVHNATNAARLVLDALVGGVGDGLLLGSVLCLLAAIPKRRQAAR